LTGYVDNLTIFSSGAAVKILLGDPMKPAAINDRVLFACAALARFVRTTPYRAGRDADAA
jgi:hypothetical protein